jgi:hypothetical protein
MVSGVGISSIEAIEVHYGTLAISSDPRLLRRRAT